MAQLNPTAQWREEDTGAGSTPAEGFFVDPGDGSVELRTAGPATHWLQDVGGGNLELQTVEGNQTHRAVILPSGEALVVEV